MIRLIEFSAGTDVAAIEIAINGEEALGWEYVALTSEIVPGRRARLIASLKKADKPKSAMKPDPVGKPAATRKRTNAKEKTNHPTA